MRLFFTAFQFLTIVPLPFRLNFKEGDMGRSMAWFPVVGLALGALLAALDFLLGFVFPVEVVSLLLVAALALVTGALHLDGLADVFDGFGARGDRERFLAVMKDSGSGAIGVTALVLGLLLKYQGLLHLPANVRSGSIILFPAVARFTQVLMAVGARKARNDGLGAEFMASAGQFQLLAAGTLTTAASFLLLGKAGIVCLVAVILFATMSRSYFHGRLGGLTGDIIGGTSELAEVLALLTLIAYSKLRVL